MFIDLQIQSKLICSLGLQFAATSATGLDLDIEFQVESNLGEQVYDADGPYDVVTCMFALHYFFERESRLRMFLRNVSYNLAPGVCVFEFGRRPGSELGL